MFCIYCGHKIDNTNHFCPYCGMRLIPSPISKKPNPSSLPLALIGFALSVIGIAATSLIFGIGAFLGISVSAAAIILCSIHMKMQHTKPITITGLSLGITGIVLEIAIIACSLASSSLY